MPIATSTYAWPHCVKCPDCGNYYDAAADHGIITSDGRIVCANCAKLYGWLVCDECHRAVDCEICDEHSYCADCAEALGWSYCEDCEILENVDEFEPAGFSGRNSYVNMPSKRKFGIELETDRCDDYQELMGDPAWGAKNDATINGKEFYSDILYGDDGLDAIERLCSFANNNDWEVDASCGYHAHFDMTAESDDSLKAIAIAYIMTCEVWGKFVDNSRIFNSMCKHNKADLSAIYAIDDWQNFSRFQTRYEWINFAAYSVHGTFEVRLHEGTLDSREICNWIRAHATFMDWASSAGWAKVRNTLICMNNEERLDFIGKLWDRAGCTDLANYYGEKACV